MLSLPLSRRNGKEGQSRVKSRKSNRTTKALLPSYESVVVSNQHQQQNPTPQEPQSLLTIAEETLVEFLSKATGTTVDWVQMIGMKA
ncbi:hypothetical protein RHSIM_Rhsim02G0114100 [Rhododendron simsii]|uniref:Uncharacterized protein n=1 Tax=Rhododendron simsii TaxID=118357 RepID=A0A834LVG2_RHOSS|nr:hypothetical protein RHSIM_Rhsim02G0114100 [Rhododendron simsii]